MRVIVSYAFVYIHRLIASQEEYLSNLRVHMSRGWGQFFFFFFFAARCLNIGPHWATKCHRWENSIWSDRWFEPRTSRIPCENSDHWAKEPHSPSTCDNFHLLNKIHSRIYSEPCWNRRESPFAFRSPNMDPYGAINVKGEEKCQKSLHWLRIEPLTLCMHQISTAPL